MAQVSLDKLLSLVGTKRPAITDRIVIRRNGLVKRIGEQIDVLENIIAYQPVAKLPKSTMKWWWQDGARYYVAVYYARAPLELAKGKYSAQCVDLPAVVNALRRLISERTKAALAQAKKRGAILGRNGAVLAQQNKDKALARRKSGLNHRGSLKGFSRYRQNLLSNCL